jgi:hypothetical protein
MAEYQESFDIADDEVVSSTNRIERAFDEVGESIKRTQQRSVEMGKTVSKTNDGIARAIKKYGPADAGTLGGGRRPPSKRDSAISKFYQDFYSRPAAGGTRPSDDPSRDPAHRGRSGRGRGFGAFGAGGKFGGLGSIGNIGLAQGLGLYAAGHVASKLTIVKRALSLGEASLQTVANMINTITTGDQKWIQDISDANAGRFNPNAKDQEKQRAAIMAGLPGRELARGASGKIDYFKQNAKGRKELQDLEEGFLIEQAQRASGTFQAGLLDRARKRARWDLEDEKKAYFDPELRRIQAEREEWQRSIGEGPSKPRGIRAIDSKAFSMGGGDMGGLTPLEKQQILGNSITPRSVRVSVVTIGNSLMDRWFAEQLERNLPQLQRQGVI